MTSGRLTYRAKFKDKENNNMRIGLDAKCYGLEKVKEYLNQDWR